MGYSNKLKELGTRGYIYFFIKDSFNKRNNEPTLYTSLNHHGQILIVSLYVDDMIYTGD